MILAGIGGAVIESKLGGVLAMFGSILILFVIPWLDTSPVRSINYRPVMRWFFWVFAVNALMLGWLGSQPAEGIYQKLSLLGTLYYFGYFLVILPVIGRLEKPRPLPESITAAVLAKHSHGH
jgi:ubiquinol-cytochrome c reductase cytochrome b subunit